MLKYAIVAAMFAATPAVAQVQQDVPLVNGTGLTIAEIYLSPASSNEWGDDLLGDQTMEDGAHGTVTFSREEDACLWDMQAKFDGGDAVVWHQLNVCEMNAVTLLYDADSGETTAKIE